MSYQIYVTNEKLLSRVINFYGIGSNIILFISHFPPNMLIVTDRDDDG